MLSEPEVEQPPKNFEETEVVQILIIEICVCMCCSIVVKAHMAGPYLKENIWIIFDCTR
jgi:hypothetical protein